ncbi:hypothetical protein H4Q26_012567 [Puccinia striiformis f. sp. tritici PST-130]|nr:hypothetical protein H4Q26_012567 [Puccinia striiformis f. sp. tritici PST-130]
MRKGLRLVGAGVQGLRTNSGTTHINKIEANTNPRKLLDRISTNHKDIAHKEQAGNIEPKSTTLSELTLSEGAKANSRKNPQPKIAIKQIS